MNYGKEGVDYLSIAISAIDSHDSITPIADCFMIERFFWTQTDPTIQKHDRLPSEV